MDLIEFAEFMDGSLDNITRLNSFEEYILIKLAKNAQRHQDNFLSYGRTHNN
jgi:hypothetical protein